MIIDTHCHYNVEPLLSEIEKHWQKSIENNVVGGICVGTDIKNSKIALKLSQKFPSMFATIAIHPEEYSSKVKSLLDTNTYSNESITQVIEEDFKEFEKLLFNQNNKKNSKLIAIGEIGLDYYRLKKRGLKREIIESVQKQIFSKQLKLAFENNLPVILHVRDQLDRDQNNAYFDVYQIVSSLVNEYDKKDKKIPPIILHCASGPLNYIKDFIKLGAYIGFAGNITYNNAPELIEILKITPKNRILLETDAPYLAPNEKKGQVCEPYLIVKTAEFLQNNFQLDLDIIFANTLKVFPKFNGIKE